MRLRIKLNKRRLYISYRQKFEKDRARAKLKILLHLRNQKMHIQTQSSTAIKKLSLQFYAANSHQKNAHNSGIYYLNKTKNYKIFNDMDYFRKNNSTFLDLYTKSSFQSYVAVKQRVNRKLK